MALWAVYRPRLSNWCQQNRCETVPGENYHDRFDFYARLLDFVPPQSSIDFLEFGVYRGASIGWWMKNNKSATSRFVGFDSFEGLPEDGNSQWIKGRFSTDGSVPKINDPRVEYQAGWFHETVPSFLRTFERRGRLIVHLDADLYTSTLLVLAHVGPLLRPHDILIFDEFADPLQEFRAFYEFEQIFRFRTTCILQQRAWMRVALRIDN